MDDREKSDGPRSTCEAAEQRPGRGGGGGGGKADRPRGTRPAKRAPDSVPGRARSSELDRVRRVAATDKEARFTALLHHVDVDRLRAAYSGVRPKAAPGVDGVTWAGLRAGSRGEPSGSACPGSQGRVPGETVAEGVHPEAGRAAAAARGRRAGGQDPSAGGGRGAERDLRADFLGFSYGFRPGRSPHRRVGCARGRDRAARR